MKDPWIAKEKFDYVLNVKKPIDYNKWVEFIELHKDYFIWQEKTEKGLETLRNIEKIPSSFRDGILKAHNKKRAFAEFDENKGYYEIYVDYNDKVGVVSTTFQKPINKMHLQLLISMAKYLDALLLKDGTEIIDEEIIKNLS